MDTVMDDGEELLAVVNDDDVVVDRDDAEASLVERAEGQNAATTSEEEDDDDDDDDDDNDVNNNKFSGMARVKVYRLNDRGHWDDKGTGFASCEYIEQSSSIGLVVVSEEDQEPLLIHRVSPQIDMYSRQEEETIISWVDNELNTDIALSFQEGCGCNFIWEQIKSVQRQYLQQSGGGALGEDGDVQNVASAVEYGGVSSEMHFSFNKNERQIIGGEQGATYLGMRQVEIELPAPDIANLPELVKLVTETSLFTRESIPKVILKTKDYIKNLLDVFTKCEDLEDMESLHLLNKLFRGLVMLNDVDLYEALLSEEFVFDFVGVLEYDPEQVERTSHREFLREKVKFKEVVEISNAAIREKIHQTCRLGYLKDVILPRVLDDSAFSMLTSMMMYNNVEVVQSLHRDAHFFPELMRRLKDAKPGDEDWNDLVSFLQELCTLARHLQNHNRLAVFASLQQHGLFDVLTDILTYGDEYSQLKAADVIMSSLQNDPAVLRDFLVKQQQDDAPNKMLSELVRLFLVGSDGIQATYLEILLFLMDPETMNNQSPEKDALLNIFYEEHMASVVSRVALGKENVGVGEEANENTVPAWALTKIIDLLIFFVQHHAYRIKYYILRNHVLQHVLQLTERKEKYVVVSAIRFLRACVHLKDEFYNRYLIKINAFAPVMKVFKTNGDRYNLLNSAVLELIDFVRRENVRNLIQHLVTTYEAYFEEVYYVDTFRLLKLRYQQVMSNTGAAGPASGAPIQGYGGREIAAAQALSEQRMRRDSSMSKDEEDYFEHDDDQRDEVATEHLPPLNTIHSPPGPSNVLHFQGSRFVPQPMANSVFSDEVDTGPTHGELGKRGRSTSPPPNLKVVDLPVSPGTAEITKKPKATGEESLTAAQRNAFAQVTPTAKKEIQDEEEAVEEAKNVKQTSNPTSSWVSVDDTSDNNEEANDSKKE